MALTPVEILHMTPGTGFFGYNRAATDRLLAEWSTRTEPTGRVDAWPDGLDLIEVVPFHDRFFRPGQVRKLPAQAEHLHVEIPASIADAFFDGTMRIR